MKQSGKTQRKGLRETVVCDKIWNTLHSNLSDIAHLQILGYFHYHKSVSTCVIHSYFSYSVRASKKEIVSGFFVITKFAKLRVNPEALL